MYKKHCKFDVIPYEVEVKLWTNETYEERVRILIEGHLRLIFKIARRYRKLDVSFEDLVQEGIIGVIKAEKKYQPMLEKRFCGYAKLWIQGMMQSFIINNWSIVKNASLGQRNLLVQEAAYNEQQIRSFTFRRDYSIHDLVPTSADEFVEFTLEDKDDPFEDCYIQEQHGAYLNDLLGQVMEVLSPAEKELILIRFFDHSPEENTPKPSSHDLTKLNKIEAAAIRKMYLYFRNNLDVLKKISPWI